MPGQRCLAGRQKFSAGVRWRDYDAFMQQFIKKLDDERLKKVPPDLDLKPYRDEHDVDLLERMLASEKRGSLPEGVEKKEIRRALDEVKAHAKAEAVASGSAA